MKNQLKRRILILFAALLVFAGISLLLNRASFDPNFSVVDAITGPTWHARRNAAKTETVIEWSYSVEDLVLPEGAAYREETLDTESGRYVLLRKADLPDDKLRILADRNNPDQAEAVLAVAEYYETLGYTVEVRKCSETMMLSLAHAEHFDLFLLREEAKEK